MSEPAVQEPVEATEGAMSIPRAETLDEATLRRVFAQAPAKLDVPRDVGSIFKQRMRGINPTWKWLGIAAIALGVIAMIAGQVVPGAVVAGGALLAAIIVAFVQYSKASDDFFETYATARGLSHTENGRISANIPLFAKGDKRKWSRVLSGTIAERPAHLGHYTYTDVSTDSEGNREETDYDFTVLAFELPQEVAARFAGVYCSPKGITFGKLQDKLAHDRGVTLESLDFHKRYTLRCVDSQDDIALYELFSTTFVQQLATELHVFWEQRGSDLVFWKKGHETEAADLDRFCLESWHVLQRYLEEWR